MCRINHHSLCIFYVLFCHACVVVFCYGHVSDSKMLFLLLESSKSLFYMAPSSCFALMVITLGYYDAVSIILLGYFDDGLVLLWTRDAVY